ncbi:MAG: carboxypeptidase-like regulatory domain-containing protein [Thermodesulfobacteriota bacterium]|nr:carboxypeptidase-like regulatory domain-containing protein [Thermodesulfobacteriota bacterium]
MTAYTVMMIRHSDPSVFDYATAYDLDVYRPVAVFTGFVNVRVLNDGHAPIEGAQVVSDGGGSSISLQDGSFMLVEEPGTYTVTASAPGFKPTSIPGVTVPELGTITMIFEMTTAVPFGTIDIKANGSDGPVTLINATPVSIDISIDPGGYAGQGADLWVYLDGYWSSIDYYSYVVPLGCVPGFRRTAAHPLVPFEEKNILNMRLLPGSYVLCYAADSNADGVMDWTRGDIVWVNVQ